MAAWTSRGWGSHRPRSRAEGQEGRPSWNLSCQRSYWSFPGTGEQVQAVGPSQSPTAATHASEWPAAGNGVLGGHALEGGPPAYRGQALEQAVESRVPEAPQAGEGR